MSNITKESAVLIDGRKNISKNKAKAKAKAKVLLSSFQ